MVQSVHHQSYRSTHMTEEVPQEIEKFFTESLSVRVDVGQLSTDNRRVVKVYLTMQDKEISCSSFELDY